jgi:multisubunit Na+/H+ antiporter MnhG subunit
MYGMAMFYFLQVADGLTTLIFLMLGISEGNPVVHFAMAQTNPVVGLVIAKTICIGAGILCSMSGRTWAIRKLNLIFTAVVLWNIASIGAHALSQAA